MRGVNADVVCYALFIYLLNLFLAFLTPKFDPALESDLAAQDVEEGEPGLPTSASAASSGSGLMSSVFHPSQGAGDQEEFRPFIRRLPEFKVDGLLMTSFGLVQRKRRSCRFSPAFLKRSTFLCFGPCWWCTLWCCLCLRCDGKFSTYSG